MEYKDYYKILGVSRDASEDEIRRVYRKLARKYHPDVSKEANAEERFKEVSEAYEVLRDPEKRAAYDQLGANWKAGQEFRPPPDWAEGFEFHRGGFANGHAGSFSDFFESLFGGTFGAPFGAAGGRRGRAASFPTKGEDTYTKILIDIEDAFRGTIRTLTLRHSERGADGRPRIRERSLKVSIPKGVWQGQKIRLAGQGEAGIGGGRAGDLYLEIEFKPHLFYRVEGRDLYIDLPVAPWEAALGATVKVPTPAGTVELKVPPDSKAGTRLRLKGRGIPGDPPGNLYVVLQIALPPAASETAKAAYREMREKLPFDPRKHLGV